MGSSNDDTEFVQGSPFEVVELEDCDLDTHFGDLDGTGEFCVPCRQCPAFHREIYTVYILYLYEMIKKKKSVNRLSNMNPTSNTDVVILFSIGSGVLGVAGGVVSYFYKEIRTFQQIEI